jgi:uncharacterized protein YbjT (DUF2867 family)
MDQRILVVGGTGMLGRPVARRMRKDGWAVRILSRSAARARECFPDGFEIVEGDIADDNSLDRALDGCDAVHINLSGGPRPEDFDRIEHRGTARVAAAAARAGTGRLTYISGISARPENRQFAPAAAKLAAAEAIADSGVPFTIFRPSWFYESLPLFIRGKSAATLGGHRVKFSWLAADDYAGIVSRSFALAEASGRIFDLHGPEPMTMFDALSRYCAIVHPEIKPYSMPITLARVVAIVTRNRTLKNVLPSMAFFDRPHNEGDPTEANRLFGAPVTTLEQWARGH